MNKFTHIPTPPTITVSHATRIIVLSHVTSFLSPQLQREGRPFEFTMPAISVLKPIPANTVRNITIVKVTFLSFMDERNEDVVIITLTSPERLNNVTSMF